MVSDFFLNTYMTFLFVPGAFLIPYMVFMIGGGIPIFFLEVALGQYMSEGGVTSWKLVPIAKGEHRFFSLLYKQVQQPSNNDATRTNNKIYTNACIGDINNILNIIKHS